jgi:hypothetical protein
VLGLARFFFLVAAAFFWVVEVVIVDLVRIIPTIFFFIFRAMTAALHWLKPSPVECHCYLNVKDSWVMSLST